LRRSGFKEKNLINPPAAGHQQRDRSLQSG
jgi:hypothetical protein